MSVIFAIILFSFLIFIHELGHFATAKAFGVQVNEFSLFMGPALWKKQRGETLYSIRCIPIGGYCAMEGEDGDSENPRAFSNAAWWKRLIILVAGATMNFVTGVAMIGVFLAPNESYILPQVSLVEENCAFSSYIQPGDTIVALDGEKIYVNSDFSLIMSLNPGDIHDLTIRRSGELLEYKNVNMQMREFPDENGNPVLRYGFSFSLAESTPGLWANMTWKTSMDTVRMVRLSLQMLFTGRAGFQDVTGPVGIVQQMSNVAEASGSAWYAFLNLLYFGGFIAINLAVMNLLPIPALDGGRVVGLLLTAVLEGVTRKKVNPKVEGYIHGAGMLLLLALMAVIMFKDIFFIVKG